MRLALCLLSVLALATCTWGQTWHRVAYDNAGEPGKQPHLIRGSAYRYPEENIPATLIAVDSRARTVAFGESVLFAYRGLNPAARYRVRMTFQSDAIREQRMLLDGKAVKGTVVLEKAPPITRDIHVPPAYAEDGLLLVAVERLSGPNAVVSEIEILSTDPAPLTAADRSLIISPKEREEARALVARLRPRYTPLPVDRPDQVLLGGTWRFCPSPPEGFEKLDDVGDDWKPIEVPGEWTMQGFTVPKGDGAGYWREFEIGESWQGKRLKLRFDAVYSDCIVWVNGKEIGGHLGGFTPFEIDVTEASRPGRNTLALCVRNESIADALASGTQYAAHALGGISRKVTLFAVPNLHVRSLHMVAEMNDSLDLGTVTAHLEVTNAGKGDADDVACRVALRPWQKGESERCRIDLGSLPAGESAIRKPQSEIRNPSLWHPEHPNLYVARVELVSSGKVVETVERRFGFRRIEVRGNEFLVNNVPVQLKGVCRHEVHPLRGRALPEGQWRKDVEVLRAGNVNHIRTSHYPPAEELMTAADELGMFVEAEGPFCWAHNAKGDAGAIREATVRQLIELVERDRSHPSVLYWSLANESQWNGHFAAASLAIRELDPTRPQTFNFFPWGGARSKPDEAYCEIGSDHYPGPGGPAKYADFDRPVCYGEYCHLNAYNRHELATDPGVRDAWGAGMAAMWENMWQSGGTLGGSLWAGIDDTFFVPPDLTVGYGTWGPIDGWRRPKPEYWHMKKAYSPIRVRTRDMPKPVAGEPLMVEVENRFDATNLKDVKIEAWFERPKSTLHLIKANIAPRSAGWCSVPVEQGDSQAGALHLRFTSPLGVVVDEYRLSRWENPAVSTAAGEMPRRPAALQVSEEGDIIRVTGKATWLISKCTGQLSCRGTLLGGPHLMVLGLNGAGGTQMKGKMPTYAPHTAPCAQWRVQDVAAGKTDDGVRVTITGGYKEAEGRFEVEFDHFGTVSVNYVFTMVQEVNPRQVGLVFDLARSCDRLSWERNGLWTTYPEDHIGRLSGRVRAFGGMHACGPAGPRVKPDWPWSLDGNEMGSNDFRSTKENIRSASLTNPHGRGVEVLSNGTQHARAWVEGERVRLLIADYTNPGAERFFRTHAVSQDKPLKKGDVVKGRTVLRVFSEADSGNPGQKKQDFK
jgi:beta-galactosidase